MTRQETGDSAYHVDKVSVGCLEAAMMDKRGRA